MSDFDLFLLELSTFSIEVEQDFPLASYTTMGVGGNAGFFVNAQKIDQFERSITLAVKHSIPFKVLGKGSNIIVSDSGYEGLIILNNTFLWQVLDVNTPQSARRQTPSRFSTGDISYKSNLTLKYSDANTDDVIVRIDSGIRVNTLMKQLYEKNITGLEWFSGIPGSVGGAIYMNMHGGDYYFGDLVEGAYITDGKNSRLVGHNYFKFDYDWSILHETKEIVLQADLRLKKGEVQEAKELAREWAIHKAQQPKRSAGCIFQNLSPEDQKKLNLPIPSIGYLVDKVLQLKGKRVGDAIISPKHAAFVENLDNASASDVFALISLVRETAKEKLDIELKLEVELLGKFENI